MIRRKTCHSLAPSTRAASSSSVLMPFRPADRMTIAKPVHIQTPTMIRAKLWSGRSFPDPASGSEPDEADDRVERPGLLGYPAGGTGT